MKVTDIEGLVQTITAQILEQVEQKTSSTDLVLACERTLQTPPKVSGDKRVRWSLPTDPLAQGLVIKELSLAQLASLVALQVPDETTKEAQAYLLAGKPVWVLETQLPKEPQKLRYGLRQKLASLQAEAQRYGVIFLAPEEALSVSSVTKRQKPVAKTGKFITAQELATAFQQKDFQLPAGSRLTPLAVDFAREHAITM